MYDFLHQEINKISPIKKTTFNKFIDICKAQQYPTEYTLTKIGDTQKKIFIILEGATRIFSKNNEGKETTKAFYTTGGYTTVLKSNLFNVPSHLEIQTLTTCSVLECTHDDVQILAKEHPDFALYQLKLLQHIIIGLENRLKELTTLSGTEKYLKLLNDIPNIHELVTQSKIASFIGVTPIQLSRIKKKIKNNE